MVGDHSSEPAGPLLVVLIHSPCLRGIREGSRRGSTYVWLGLEQDIAFLEIFGGEETLKANKPVSEI